jgi:hypothetical protein
MLADYSLQELTAAAVQMRMPWQLQQQMLREVTFGRAPPPAVWFASPPHHDAMIKM